MSVLVAGAAGACGAAGESPSEWRDDFTFPAELRGRWITDNPRYQDRMLEIQADAVVFYTGGVFGLSAHRIRQARRRPGNRPGTLYEIRYRSNSPDELYTFAFYYRSANGGEIRFENQPQIVWTRAEGSR